MTAPKTLSIRTLISIGILLISLAAANGSYLYHEVYRAKDHIGELPFLEGDFKDLSAGRIYAAGWPSKFYIGIQYDGLPLLTTFSWRNLALNLGLGGIGVACIALYEWQCYRKRARSPGGEKRRLSIIDLLVCTALLATVLAYWRSLEQASQSEMVVAREIMQAGGTTIETVQLPGVVGYLLPESLRLRIKRVSEVTLNAPSSELLAKAIALPYLARLSIGGGEYDLRLLDRLARKPLLSRLRISGRELDAQTVASVAACRQVQSLNLMRTNITAKALESFGDMPRLQSLNVIRTDVALAELSAPAWAKTIRTLHLPHPAPGQATDLKLEGWPELRTLVCNEYDERINAEPVRVELKHLPKLSQLALDALQVFDLHLEDLPELAEIEVLHSQWTDRESRLRIVPQSLSISKLAVTRTPKLASLSLYTPALIEMNFSEPMKMRLDLNADRMMTDGVSFQTSDKSGLPVLKAEKWMRGWGGEVCPTALRFDGLKLDDVDLAPLAQCTALRQLDFSNCQIKPEQLRLLGGMDALQELSIGGCAQDGETVAWLATNLPNLRKLVCDPFMMEHLDLEKHATLETILPNPDFPLFRSVELKVAAMPKLKDALNLAKELKTLHVEGTPSLTGFSTRAPWPAQAVFKGVRDLTYFAAGGQRLDDRVAEAVLACERLNTLTLAYSSVSPEMLCKVGTLKGLSYLALSGSRVDDEVVAQWQSLPGLRTLRLDDTAITDESVDFILACKDLEHLALRNTKITEQGLARLAKLSKLSRIDCGDEDWSAAKMNAVLTIPALTILDLSFTKLSPQALAALVQSAPRRLEQLILRHSEAEGKALLQLARNNSGLIFDLTDANVDENTLAAFSGSRQLARPYNEDLEWQRTLSEYLRSTHDDAQGSRSNRLPGVGSAMGMVNPNVFAGRSSRMKADSLSRFDPPAAIAGPEAVYQSVPMSLPAWIGYAIGNLSKSFSTLPGQGGNDAVQY